jgi:hypothetical protein
VIYLLLTTTVLSCRSIAPNELPIINNNENTQYQGQEQQRKEEGEAFMSSLRRASFHSHTPET